MEVIEFREVKEVRAKCFGAWRPPFFVFAKITNHSIKRCARITDFVNIITLLGQDGEPDGPVLQRKRRCIGVSKRS